MEQERGFSNQDLAPKLLLLAEEVGELIKSVRKSHADIGLDVNKKYDHDTAGELADILIVLTCVANRLGVDLEKAFRDKEEKNKSRTWK